MQANFNRWILFVVASLTIGACQAGATVVDLSQGLVWGVNGHAGWNAVPDHWVPITTQMQKMQEAGLKIYRYDVSRIDAGTSNRLTEVTNAADQFGIQVLPVLLALTHDGDGNLLLQDGRVATPENAYAYSYSLGSYYAKYFGARAPVFEIGNEYDDLTIYKGTDGASFTHYDPEKFWIAHESLRGLSEGVKNANSSVQTMVSYTWCHYGYADMIWNGMLPGNPTAGVVTPIKWDITSQHWYYGMNEGNPTAAGCWSGPTNILEIDRTHYDNRPIWITEFGDEKSAKALDKPTMASHLEGMMERVSLIADQYNIQAAVLYELYDSGVEGAEGYFGMCTVDGNCDNDYYRMVKWYTSTRQHQLRP